MNTTTIPKNLIKTKNDDLVVISRKERENMKAKILPVYFLKGAKAKKLDNIEKLEFNATLEDGQEISTDSFVVKAKIEI